MNCFSDCLNPHFVDHVLIFGFGLFFLFLLESIFLALALAASKALGGKPLVSESSPWSEIFAAFAPLDLQAARANDPDVDIAQGAQSLVLGRDDSVSVALLAHQVLGISGSGFTGFLVLFVLVAVRAGTRLATHDTTTHAFREIHRLLL